MHQPDAHSAFNPSYVGTRPDILALVPARARTVLDVGCSNGTLGESVKQSRPGAFVVGVELEEAMGQAARQRLDRVVIGDIEADSTLAALEHQRFDAVICADVLEHLRDPWALLCRLRRHLLPEGVLIASLPNVRHIDTLFNLAVKGVWPYRDRGIHDRTHLRFFTRRTIVELFERGSYRIERMTAHYRIIERPHRMNRFAGYLALPGIAPFLAFQYLVTARQDESHDQH